MGSSALFPAVVPKYEYGLLSSRMVPPPSPPKCLCWAGVATLLMATPLRTCSGVAMERRTSDRWWCDRRPSKVDVLVQPPKPMGSSFFSTGATVSARGWCEVRPSTPDVLVLPPYPTAGAAGAAATGAGAAGAGAAGAAAAPPPRCFRYSSKEGAAEMDLRGSSCSKASGLRVSAIPPAPIPLRSCVEARWPESCGLKAAAPPARTARARH
mmetsp:Transcript_33364/g.98381  ORF Transcript_33364/g.98381 Transcript_33364/m.98381 type:complete len:211 (+) Transcript_33364:400-1032(+)